MQKTDANAPGKDLKERDQVVDAKEVRGDMKPATEASSLTPYWVVLMVDFLGEYLGK